MLQPVTKRTITTPCERGSESAAQCRTRTQRVGAHEGLTKVGHIEVRHTEDEHTTRHTNTNNNLACQKIICFRCNISSAVWSMTQLATVNNSSRECE